MKQECFSGSKPIVIGTGKPIVIGTGGFAGHYSDEDLFDAIRPDLALEGIRVAQEPNG